MSDPASGTGRRGPAFPKRPHSPGGHPPRGLAKQREREPRPQPRPGPPPRPAEPATPAADTAWEGQAQWYDERQGQTGDDFHSRLVLPAVVRALAARKGERVLDLACGQGLLGRILAELGVASLGLDASPSLISASRLRTGEPARFVLGDARKCGELLVNEQFDHGACVLALADLDPIKGLLAGAATLIKPGGRLVLALTHPCFRVPQASGWGWDETKQVQYRRLDGYLLPRKVMILTHPGVEYDRAASTHFHRPLSLYLNALGAAGFGVVGAQELCSHRRGSQGRKSAAEDKAAREFPVFLILTAVRLPICK